MLDLKNQEQFEIEVLDKLNSRRLLNSLVFGGGTMLRLCYGLDRYSVDLDFWIIRKLTLRKLFNEIEDCLRNYYEITDSAEKRNTLLFEFRTPSYPRLLKIEIRKDIKKIKPEPAIAYSKYSNLQVLVNTVSLPDMMRAKIDAFLDRREIRDVYDIEFLHKKGIVIEAGEKKLKSLLRLIDMLGKNDYNVKLGSILEPGLRKYYRDKNFTILKLHIESLLK